MRAFTFRSVPIAAVMAAVCLSAAAPVLRVHAFPTRFMEVTAYSSAGCNNSAAAGATLVYALDECYTLTATTSARYSIGGVSSGLVYTTFTGSVCAGAGTDVPFSSAVSGSGVTCVSAGLTAKQYTVPSTRASSIYGMTYFSDDACATVSTATFPNPSYALGGVCAGTAMNAFTNGKLQSCTYASNNCGGSPTCTDVNNGYCQRTSSGGSYQSAQYSYNASPRAAVASTAAVALLAALVAVVTRSV